MTTDVFRSHLCANTDLAWPSTPFAERRFDLLFSGRLVAGKSPKFFMAVAGAIAERLGRPVSAAVLGSGPMESAMRDAATALHGRVEVVFAGHVQQTDLPMWYGDARLLMFPTRYDVWGVVANEAMQCGTPVLVSPHAGVAGELVRDGGGGRVLPLEEGAWRDAACGWLANADEWARQSEAAREAVAPYNFENAASGFLAAATHATAPRVVCVQRRLTQYRVPAFEKIRDRLAAGGVRFDLVVGDALAHETARRDEGQIEWVRYAPCRYFLGGRLCWQYPGAFARRADLLVLTQENKLLYNYLALTFLRPRRLAFWGHGRNFQISRPHTWQEKVRAICSRSADWWFAYSNVSSAAVKGFGFPVERIIDVENAVDTAGMVALCNAVTDDEIAAFRDRWCLGQGPIGLFIGSLYPEKRLELLIEACEQVVESVPEFRLIVVGDGPDRPIVEAMAARKPWLRYGAVKSDRKKAIALRAAALLLNPGAVGLGILDGFAAGLPIVTSDCGLHGPEIAYLRVGENGLVAPQGSAGFANVVTALLRDSAQRDRMAAVARRDASHYTLEHMVERFCRGVAMALAAHPR